MVKPLVVSLAFALLLCPSLESQKNTSPKPVPQPRAKRTEKDKAANELNDVGGSPQSGTEAVPFHVETHRGPATGTEATKERDAENREARAKVWERVIAFLALCIAGVQGLIFWRQLIVFRRQSEATERQTALTSELERARLSVNLSFSSHFPMNIDGQKKTQTVTVVKVVNFGRSAANITRTELRFHALREPDNLPTLPKYLHNIEGSTGVLPPAKEQMYFIVKEGAPGLSDDEIRDISNGLLRIYCYGKIDYESLGKVHCLQFCERYFLPEEGAPDFAEGFRVDGPSSYNQAT